MRIVFLFVLIFQFGCSVGVSSSNNGPTPDTTIESPGYPWQIFQDWTGQISSGGYTEEQREEIAAMGMGVFSLSQALSDSGRAEFEAIRQINPDFVFTCVFSTLVVPSSEPEWETSFLREVWSIFKDHPARHQDDATSIRSWPPTGDVTAYWHNVLPATNGKSYNRALFDELIDALENRMNEYPGQCEGMWQDYFTTTGPYVFPDQELLHGPADLDQDGVPFSNDGDEQKAWNDWQRDFVRTLTERFGPGFFHFPNGRAVYPGYDKADEELASLVHGAIFENFPNLPWYDQAESLDQLFQFTISDWSQPNRGHLWRMLFAGPNATDQQWQTARIASMVFLTPYARLAGSGPTLFFRDDHGINAGQPTGNLTRTVSGTRTTYQRQFELGVAKIVTDSETGLATATFE